MILEDPYTRRAFQKPRGYAGDAELIDLIYDRKLPDETSALGRALFEVTTGFPPASAVRERRTLAHDYLREAIRAGKTVCVIASGHFREADDLAGQNLDLVTAVDLDAISLGKIVAVHGERINVVHDNALSFLRKTVRSRKRYDLIYTLGLSDYLGDKTLIFLLRLMKSCAEKEGKCVYANFLPGNIAEGWMDACMDWQLVYRTEEDLLRFAAMIGCSARVWRDKTNSIAWCEMVMNPEVRDVQATDLIKYQDEPG